MAPPYCPTCADEHPAVRQSRVRTALIPRVHARGRCAVARAHIAQLHVFAVLPVQMLRASMDTTVWTYACLACFQVREPTSVEPGVYEYVLDMYYCYIVIYVACVQVTLRHV